MLDSALNEPLTSKKIRSRCSDDFHRCHLHGYINTYSILIFKFWHYHSNHPVYKLTNYLYHQAEFGNVIDKVVFYRIIDEYSGE